MRSRRPWIVALALVVAACGGSSDGTGTADSDDGASADDTVATTVAEAETTTSTAPTSDTPELPVEGSRISLTADGETYVFALSDPESGECDPDFFGGFRAWMSRVDESGAEIPIEASDTPEGITISIGPDLDGLIAGEFGGSFWAAGSADDFEESTIDSLSIDGNRATGSATLMRDETDLVEASFEAVCEGSG